MIQPLKASQNHLHTPQFESGNQDQRLLSGSFIHKLVLTEEKGEGTLVIEDIILPSVYCPLLGVLAPFHAFFSFDGEKEKIWQSQPIHGIQLHRASNERFCLLV